MSIYPMPSPNGTNHEGYFILRGRRSTPQAAYDSAMTPAQVRAYATREARRLLGLDSAMPDDGIEPYTVGRDNGDAVSQIAEWCKNNLEPSGRQALIDALNDTGGMTMDRRGRHSRRVGMDSASADSFDAMFPDAARIGSI